MARSPLDTLAKTVARSFKGKLKSGTIRREVAGTGVDQWGDSNPGTVATFSFEGIRSSISAKWVAAGVPITDVSVLVILGSVKPVTVPTQGDQINIEGGWHSVVALLEKDPANASAEYQCTQVQTPTT